MMAPVTLYSHDTGSFQHSQRVDRVSFLPHNLDIIKKSSGFKLIPIILSQPAHLVIFNSLSRSLRCIYIHIHLHPSIKNYAVLIL